MTQSLSQYDLVIRGRALIQDNIVDSTIAVDNGMIAAIVDSDAPVQAATELQLDETEVLIPGVVDTHVHINEPGRTAWEGFECATQAAVLGGVTTVIDMPLNSNPPTLTVEALELKRSLADRKAVCELGFWGGVDASNLGHLRELWEAGVFGFKCFLSPSGVDEYGSLSYSKLEEAMREIAAFDGRLIVHAEDPAELATHANRLEHNTCCYRDFAASRPASSESTAVARVVELVRRTQCRTHILHVSSGQTTAVIAAAKAEGLPITAETCPHYLTLDCDTIPDGNTAFKCCPPIRDKQEQDRLWQALLDGVLDIVVTDHSPTTPHMKAGSLATAWGGVSSLQVGFRAVLTAAQQRGLTLADVVRWMCANTAEFAGLHDRGVIAVGKRADLTVLRPDACFTVDATTLASRNPISAFDGMTLDGVVTHTLIGGVEPCVNPEHIIARA